MCGILTVFSNYPLGRSEINESLNSLQRIKHRGPDGEGVLLINTHTGETKSLRTKDTPENITCHYQELSEVPENQFNLLLGHRRLSIIDLSVQGHQPMQSGEVSLIYNGEIYNYLELKEELKAKGRIFKTNSDSEVLIQAYLEWGADCLNKFNGMWSFVLWDNNKQKLFIANDRFGVKPLYHTQVEDKTILVSEIKQYLDFTSFKREFNKEYFNNYIKVGSTNIGLETPFYGVKRFPCGHFTEQKTKDVFRKELFKEYYSIYNIKKEKWKESDAIHTFRELFFDSVEIRTRADVPYGIGLSGGLDSSSVLLGVKKILDAKGLNEKPFTFSAVFPGNEEDESNYVKQVLDKIPSNSFFTNPLKEFTQSDFKKHIYHQEILPTTTAYFSQYKVAELVKKQNVKVLLVGQGADEVFAGYHEHFHKYIREMLLRLSFVSSIKQILNYSKIKSFSNHDLFARAYSELKLGMQSIFNKSEVPFPSNINSLHSYLLADFSKLQLPVYLNSDDRTSMAHSIETRHPFLDFRLVEFGYSLPNSLLINYGWQKRIIRESMNQLPDSVSWRKDKRGFSNPQSEIISRNKEFFIGEKSSKKVLGINKKVLEIFKMYYS